MTVSRHGVRDRDDLQVDVREGAHQLERQVAVGERPQPRPAPGSADEQVGGASLPRPLGGYCDEVRGLPDQKRATERVDQPLERRDMLETDAASAALVCTHTTSNGAWRRSVVRKAW